MKTFDLMIIKTFYLMKFDLMNPTRLKKSSRVFGFLSEIPMANLRGASDILDQCFSNVFQFGGPLHKGKIFR